MEHEGETDWNERFRMRAKKFAEQIGGKLIICQFPCDEWKWKVNITGYRDYRAANKAAIWIQIELPDRTTLELNTSEMSCPTEITAWYLYPKGCNIKLADGIFQCDACFMYYHNYILGNKTYYEGAKPWTWELQQKFPHMQDLIEFTKVSFGVEIRVLERDLVSHYQYY